MFNSQLTAETSFDWEQVHIIEAVSERERQDIYHFRYQVQIEEMNRGIPYADHLRKRIYDDLDSWSYLAYAEFHGNIIATARATVGTMDQFPDELAAIFKLARCRNYNYDSKICLGTKLMVDARYRKTPVFFRLMTWGYEIMRRHDVVFSFGGCNPYLVPIYRQLGYYHYSSGFQDPGYGFVIPIVLFPEDKDHFVAMRSPYLRIARKYSDSTLAREWFFANLSEVAKYHMGSLGWDYVAARVGDPLTALPVLGALNREQAGKLLQIATPFECGAGQQFIRRGDVCNELNILLSGEMAVTGEAGRTFRAGPGETIGAVGLADQTHHQIDATAVSDCEILAVSRFPFEKLQRAIPGLLERLRTEKSSKEEY